MTTNDQRNEYDEALSAFTHSLEEEEITFTSFSFGDVICRALRLASRLERSVSEEMLDMVTAGIRSDAFISYRQQSEKIVMMIFTQLRREALANARALKEKL